MLRLRQIVLDTASETEGVDALEETLKWGEPSYLTRDGSTIRKEVIQQCHTKRSSNSKDVSGS